MSPTLTQPPQTGPGAGISDGDLVNKARAGEMWAKEALFRRYARMVHGLVYRLVGQDPEAQDLVQDAFTEALKGLNRLRDPQAFASFLGSVTVRTVRGRLRRWTVARRIGLHQSSALDFDTFISPQAPPEVVRELRAVYGVVDKLPADERIVLILRRVEGLRLDEICQHVGKSKATVKRRLQRAEAKLTAAFGADRLREES